MPKPHVPPGIYHGMPLAEYRAAEGLSFHGMKDLAVSPLQYWERNINPDHKEPEKFGSAVHAAVLEPDEFSRRYATWPKEADYPNVLKTIDDIKAYLASEGLPTIHKRKQDLIDRVKYATIQRVTIWDEVIAAHARENADKTLLDDAEMGAVKCIASLLREDPETARLLEGGSSEVSIFARDPATGVMLKARLDYVAPGFTTDLKTFSNQRNKPILKAISDAIYYEGYYIQSRFYTFMREESRQVEITPNPLPFHFVFVESSAPHHVRVVTMNRNQPGCAEQNLYWLQASQMIRDSINTYAEYSRRFGEHPWRAPSKAHMLADEDLRGLIFS